MPATRIKTIRDISQTIFAPEHIFVTRHAESEGQLDVNQYKICGDDHIPITQHGHYQAYHAGEILRGQPTIVSSLYHSTSLRAQQTAEDMAGALYHRPPVIPDHRIDKQRFGLFDGHFTDQERQFACPEGYAKYQEDLHKLGPIAARPPEGESILDVIERVGKFVSEAGTDGTPRIAVAHGLGVLSIEALLMGHDDDWLLDAQDSSVNAELLHFYRGDDGHYHREVIEEPAPGNEVPAHFDF